MSTEIARNNQESVTYETKKKGGRKSRVVPQVEPKVATTDGHDPLTDWCAAEQTNPVYRTLYKAFDFYNVALFGDQLPRLVITLRKGVKYKGYYHPAQFKHADVVADHIAMNATHFDEAAPEDALSTLVHEMVHHWQHHFGTPGRRAYHNKEWAAKMCDLGLIPHPPGEPGGPRQTGQRITHTIDPEGPFFLACAVFLRDTPDLVLCREKASPSGKGKDRSKTKFTCPRCGHNMWGAPGSQVGCKPCGYLDLEECRS